MVGWKREIVWGFRIFDLDILFYSNEIIYMDRLSVFYFWMFEWVFVMVFLNELVLFFIFFVVEEKVEIIIICLLDLKDVKLFWE